MHCPAVFLSRRTCATFCAGVTADRAEGENCNIAKRDTREVSPGHLLRVPAVSNFAATTINERQDGFRRAVAQFAADAAIASGETRQNETAREFPKSNKRGQRQPGGSTEAEIGEEEK